MTPAFNYISSSLTNIPKSSENALLTQPKNSYKAFLNFYLPQMKPAILLGIMIVFIESIKEQPATLLLRPVGFDTLSTKVYNFTSEGQWIMASSPSLLLILLSLIFVYLINKNIDFNKYN
jgi:iron(III) transport system permease protein